MSLVSVDRALEMVGQFQDAAFDPERWLDALTGLRGVFGADWASILAGPTEPGRITIAHASGPPIVDAGQSSTIDEVRAQDRQQPAGRPCAPLEPRAGRIAPRLRERLRHRPTALTQSESARGFFTL